MKTLIIMRHGEAENSIRGGNDKDRELTDDGVRDVLLKGHWMNENSISFQKVIASDAVRTKQTAGLIAEKCSVSMENVSFYELLYNASLGKILNEVNKFDDALNSILIVAHNPGVSYLLEYLTGETIVYNEAGVAEITFDLDDWAVISKGLGTIKQLSN